MNLRLFLFQTAPGSGVEAGLAPLTTDENLGVESLVPVPVLATRRGRDDDNALDPGGGVFEPVAGLSIGLAATPLGLPFEARNVLFTDTALKVAGFLTVEADRP